MDQWHISFTCFFCFIDGPGLDVSDEEWFAQSQPTEPHPGWQCGDQPRESFRRLSVSLSVPLLVGLEESGARPGIPNVLHRAFLRAQHNQESAGDLLLVVSAFVTSFEFYASENPGMCLNTLTRYSTPESSLPFSPHPTNPRSHLSLLIALESRDGLVIAGGKTTRWSTR